MSRWWFRTPLIPGMVLPVFAGTKFAAPAHLPTSTSREHSRRIPIIAGCPASPWTRLETWGWVIASPVPRWLLPSITRAGNWESLWAHWKQKPPFYRGPFRRPAASPGGEITAPCLLTPRTIALSGTQTNICLRTAVSIGLRGLHLLSSPAVPRDQLQQR